MKNFTYSLMTLGVCLFTTAFAQNEIVDKTTNVSFPREVSFNYNGTNYNLQATGVATRKKLIINVYSMAHYLQKNPQQDGDKLQTILSDNNAKQITMKWVRDVPAHKVIEGYHDSFNKALSNQEYSQLNDEIERFLQFFRQDAHKGDEYVLRWVPGGIVEVQINGNKVGNVTNKEFAKALWTIWFGDKSVVNRDALLSQ